MYNICISYVSYISYIYYVNTKYNMYVYIYKHVSCVWTL